ncbi:MAG: Ldh family oxidoreductase [Victivallales bacterium]
MVENSNSKKKIEVQALTHFCREVFEKCGLDTENAQYCAEVLVAADVRGIPSHGVGRLWRYVNGLLGKQMRPDTKDIIVRESSTSLVVDADGGMGAPVSIRTMNAIIQKAETTGAAFGCVKNSNHFGIAGYYAMMALEHDMLGIAMTNTAALGVPTFGRQVMFGTNPLAFCAPADKEKAFVLDMSTTTVSRGKVEVYNREGKMLPEGWAVDSSGLTATDAGKILTDMLERRGGGLLPLGGFGETFGGYKGYGLAVMVDILCAVLAGSQFGSDVYDKTETSARVSHFFGAVKISGFRNPADFRRDLDIMLERLRSTPPAEGENRVYFAGQKEFEYEKKVYREGLLLDPGTSRSLEQIARKFAVEWR